MGKFGDGVLRICAIAIEARWESLVMVSYEYVPWRLKREARNV